MKEAAKRIVRAVFSRFAHVIVLHSAIDRTSRAKAEAASHASTPQDRAVKGLTIRQRETAHRLEFDAIAEDRVASSCHVWTSFPHPDSDIARLSDGQYMLGALHTDESFRGRGYASELVRRVTQIMRERGSTAGIAVVWHSNLPSVSTFIRSGWQPASHVLVLRLRGLRRQFRLEWRPARRH